MEQPFALEWTHQINRLDGAGKPYTTPGHQFCNDRDDVQRQFEQVKANPSVIEIKVYERINGQFQVIEGWP